MNYRHGFPASFWATCIFSKELCAPPWRTKAPPEPWGLCSLGSFPSLLLDPVEKHSSLGQKWGVGMQPYSPGLSSYTLRRGLVATLQGTLDQSPAPRASNVPFVKWVGSAGHMVSRLALACMRRQPPEVGWTLQLLLGGPLVFSRSPSLCHPDRKPYYWPESPLSKCS